MLFYLLILQLVFGIRTVVGRSQYILQHNLWSQIAKGFMDATFVWSPCHFSIWETIKSITSVRPPDSYHPFFLSSHRHNCVYVSPKS